MKLLRSRPDSRTPLRVWVVRPVSCGQSERTSPALRKPAKTEACGSLRITTGQSADTFAGQSADESCPGRFAARNPRGRPGLSRPEPLAPHSARRALPRPSVLQTFARRTIAETYAVRGKQPRGNQQTLARKAEARAPQPRAIYRGWGEPRRAHQTKEQKWKRRTRKY
jgi:hypothetical protein